MSEWWKVHQQVEYLKVRLSQRRLWQFMRNRWVAVTSVYSTAVELWVARRGQQSQFICTGMKKQSVSVSQEAGGAGRNDGGMMQLDNWGELFKARLG